MWLRKIICHNMSNAQFNFTETNTFESTLEMYFHATLLELVKILHWANPRSTHIQWLMGLWESGLRIAVRQKLPLLVCLFGK
jgi:hypothetical protein